MSLEFRHNDGFDSIVLVDHAGTVRSDWTVTKEVLREYLDLSVDSEWDDRGGDEHRPEDYGSLIASRDGRGTITIEDEKKWEERLDFHLGH